MVATANESEGASANGKSAVNAVGLSPIASMALAFAVLLEGVTNGDLTPKAPDQRLYVVAAIMLGIAGVSYFLQNGDSKRPSVEIASLGRIGLAEWWAGISTRVVVDITTQLLAIYLAYLLCKRGSDVVAAAFILAVFVGLTFYGVVSAALRWFFAIRRVNDWLKRRRASGHSEPEAQASAGEPAHDPGCDPADQRLLASQEVSSRIANAD